MATLEEVSTSAREEDLDRRSFQIDNLQITKLDTGRLYATKENKKETIGLLGESYLQVG